MSISNLNSPNNEVLYSEDMYLQNLDSIDFSGPKSILAIGNAKSTEIHIGDINQATPIYIGAPYGATGSPIFIDGILFSGNGTSPTASTANMFFGNTGATGTTSISANTWVHLNGLDSSFNLNNFTLSAPDLITYTGPGENALIVANFCSHGSTGSTINANIAINGATGPEFLSGAGLTFNDPTLSYQLSMNKCVNLATNDTIDIQVHSNITTNLFLEFATLSVIT